MPGWFSDIPVTLTLSALPPSLRIPNADFLTNAKRPPTIPPALRVIILLLFLPEEASFFVGGLRLTLIRAAFIVLAPVVLVKLGRRVAAGRYYFVLSDLFVPLASLWMIIAPAMIVGTSEALNHSGPVVLEFCVGYLATRTLLSEHEQALSLVGLLCFVIAIVALLGVFDPLTDHFFMRDLAGKLTGYSKGFGAASYENAHRLGVLRATSTLEHPIAFGLVCTVSLILAANLPIQPRKFILLACGIGVVISITSSMYQALLITYALLRYDRVLKSVRYRWCVLIGIAVFSIILIFTSIDRPMGFIMRHLILDEQSGDFRLYVWDVATQVVAGSPWFGIGYEIPVQYDLPYSVDSVWLVSALTYGIPGAVLIALAVIGSASLPTNGPRAYLTTAESKLGTMLGIIIFLIIFWGFTVHFWGTDWILIALLAGVRAHLGELARMGRS